MKNPILISHRGNLIGRSCNENKPLYIEQSIYNGFICEIDLWYINDSFLLGHDKPEYSINKQWLISLCNDVVCHAKNIEAFNELYNMKIMHFFMHDKELATFTNKGYIWYYPSKIIYKNGINLFPKIELKSLNCYGICSDNVIQFRKLIEDYND